MNVDVNPEDLILEVNQLQDEIHNIETTLDKPFFFVAEGRTC